MAEAWRDQRVSYVAEDGSLMLVWRRYGEPRDVIRVPDSRHHEVARSVFARKSAVDTCRADLVSRRIACQVRRFDVSGLRWDDGRRAA